MIDFVSQDLQAKCINKILILNMNKLNEEHLKNKFSYLLSLKNEDIVNYISRKNTIYKIIDLALESNNYKRALRYSCLLVKYINEIINLVENKDIKKLYYEEIYSI